MRPLAVGAELAVHNPPVSGAVSAVPHTEATGID